MYQSNLKDTTSHLNSHVYSAVPMERDLNYSVDDKQKMPLSQTGFYNPLNDLGNEDAKTDVQERRAVTRDTGTKRSG